MTVPTILDEATWLARRAAHERRVDELTGDHLARAAAGRKHPVEDFLFTYYPFRPGQLRRWHPGAGVELSGELAMRTFIGRWYRRTDTGVVLDTASYIADREQAVRRTADLLRATAGRPAHLACFGMHEWAMAYRLRQDQQRHPELPLRLGEAGTDAVVEATPVRCTHADAFRFFTPQARPLNAVQPTRQTQADHEQPGCLHATMDLYRLAFRLSPATSSELVLDCFELARQVRVLDMRASPYDLSSLGLTPVPVETTAGRARYVAAQKEFAGRAAPLRERILRVCETLLATHPAD